MALFFDDAKAGSQQLFFSALVVADDAIKTRVRQCRHELLGKVAGEPGDVFSQPKETARAPNAFIHPNEASRFGPNTCFETKLLSALRLERGVNQKKREAQERRHKGPRNASA